MRKFKTVTLTVSAMLVASSQTIAAISEVNWLNSEKYQDIRAGEEHREHFKRKIFKAFEQHFSKLAEKLPEEQVLKISVINVDLAGDVNHGGINRYRLIKGLYFPKMKFSYQIVDSNNIEINAGVADLKDMNFLMHSNLKYRNTFLGYEFQMLDKWFHTSFVKPKKQQS